MKRYLFIATILAAIAIADRASACSVCFADPESPQGQALNAAVWTLMGATTFVLGGAGVFIGTIVYRSRVAVKEDAANA